MYILSHHLSLPNIKPCPRPTVAGASGPPPPAAFAFASAALVLLNLLNPRYKKGVRHTKKANCSGKILSAAAIAILVFFLGFCCYRLMEGERERGREERLHLRKRLADK